MSSLIIFIYVFLILTYIAGIGTILWISWDDPDRGAAVTVALTWPLLLSVVLILYFLDICKKSKEYYKALYRWKQ